MTDIETAIMIKNMARETVRRMTAKNATQFKRGDKVTVDGKYEGVVQEVKAGYYEVRIFDGSRVVGTRVVWPKDIAARNATGKNAVKYVQTTDNFGRTEYKAEGSDYSILHNKKSGDRRQFEIYKGDTMIDKAPNISEAKRYVDDYLKK